MGRHTLFLVVLTAAALSVGFPGAVLAQNYSGQPAGGQVGNPPNLVGRLAQISGTVSFHNSDESQWQPATLNYPVTSGNSFWTETNAHAAVDVGASRVYMDSSTELDIGTLNDQGFIASLPRGAVFLRAVGASSATAFEIDTPRGQVHITQPGDYEVTAGDTNNPTVVTTFDGGSAQVVGDNINLSIGPQQAGAISGSGTSQDPFQSASGAAREPDQFAQYVQSAEQPYQTAQAPEPQPQQAPSQSIAPPVSPEMTGAGDLSLYGTWQSTPDYGQVWYPQVDSSWAPYRNGHWAYIAPWGWTWIDDAPWGFAPFHYGRWVWYDDRWGWAPGAYQPYPVYAPALVNFFGDFGGVGVDIAFGDVGWVPLGWGEPYYPSYPVSYDCFSSLNVAFVNTTIINYNVYRNYYYGGHRDERDFGFDHWRNHDHGATMVSADVLRHSRPVADAWRHSPQGGWNRQWAHARSWGGQAPVKPTYATAGISPRTAQRLGLKEPAGGFQQRHSPGPVIAANQFRNGRATVPAGFPSRNSPGKGPSATQLFTQGTKTHQGPFIPTKNGQTAGNGRGNQSLFAGNQGGLNGQNTHRGGNGGLVGRFMKTPPLFGGNSNGTNHNFAGGSSGVNSGQKGIGNWQNGGNFARNYLKQPRGQPQNGTHNWQGGNNLARNYFQPPSQPQNGTHNWQGGNNLARNYFQPPGQPQNGTRTWQSGSNPPRSYFQQPNVGTRNWQNGGYSPRNYNQQPFQPYYGSTRNWQNGGNQTRNFFQQPQGNWQNNAGQSQGFRQQWRQNSNAGQWGNSQRNWVSNNGQGWGGAYSRQQQPTPQYWNQGQSGSTTKKKFNN